MTFELLVSTMHKNNMQEIRDMLIRMNVKCNCLVINQCAEENVFVEENNGQKLLAIFTKERGLSKSRNMALKNSSADIVAIADDDLYYYDNFDKIIVDYYKKNKKADVVLFGIDSYRKICEKKEQKCNFLKLVSYISVQTTLKRMSVLKKNIIFNELFGTGSGCYDSGEENLFLADCYKKKLSLFYCPEKILKDVETESSWFKGYTEKFCRDRGAIFYAMSPLLSNLFIFAFAFCKRKLLKPITFFKATKLMFEEKKHYISILK